MDNSLISKEAVATLRDVLPDRISEEQIRRFVENVVFLAAVGGKNFTVGFERDEALRATRVLVTCITPEGFHREF